MHCVCVNTWIFNVYMCIHVCVFQHTGVQGPEDDITCLAISLSSFVLPFYLHNSGFSPSTGSNPTTIGFTLLLSFKRIWTALWGIITISIKIMKNLTHWKWTRKRKNEGKRDQEKAQEMGIHLFIHSDIS